MEIGTSTGGCQTGDVRDPWEDEKQPSASVGDVFFVFLRTGKRTHTFLDAIVVEQHLCSTKQYDRSVVEDRNY